MPTKPTPNHRRSKLPRQRPNRWSIPITQTSKAEDIFDKDEVFLARTGDVIEVNGEDGFDRIDLACYDINCASISSNKIRIDDEQTGSFEIHFIDVDYAIFANRSQNPTQQHALILRANTAIACFPPPRRSTWGNQKDVIPEQQELLLTIDHHLRACLISHKADDTRFLNLKPTCHK